MCTGVRLKAADKSIVYGRTLEFGQDMQSQFIVIPRKFGLSGTLNNGSGLQWKSQYAAVGANALGMNELLDGVNEKGLAGGLFYFPGYAQYQEVTAANQAHAIAPWQLMTWILTTCESVAEVKKALATITVSNVVLTQWGITPPVHAIVHDVTGASIVIEYTSSGLNIYDNPLGVITNSPSFDWHMTNLRNYISLTSINSPSITLDEINFTPFGQGSGMFGLPGDFTPPSRFVRAVAFSKTISQTKNADECRDAVFHVLNLFDIPKGVVCEVAQGQTHCDVTQWTGVSDLANARYYVRSYDNQSIQMIDLKKCNLDAAQPMLVPFNTKQYVEDRTPK